MLLVVVVGRAGERGGMVRVVRAVWMMVKGMDSGSGGAKGRGG